MSVFFAGLQYADITKHRVYKREVDRLIAKTNAGTQKECFATEFLKQSEKTEFDETQKLFVLGSLMEAGSDTTKVSLGQIIAGAATFPDWVSRARKQLDDICGQNAERLPGWDDKERLPYISAVVKEGFRWRPNIAEIGAPTLLTTDDEYEGYKFPAGTVFTWNSWAISLSDKEYPEAERFYPERFLNADLNNVLKGHYAFGPGEFFSIVLRSDSKLIIDLLIGRRVCVGWSVGDQNVWIAIARLLYCFDFVEDKVRSPSSYPYHHTLFPGSTGQNADTHSVIGASN